MFIFKRKRPRERACGGGAGWGEKESQADSVLLQALSCQHRARCGARTHNL